MRYDAGSYEYKGATYPLQVDGDTGDWKAEVGGHRLSAETRYKLIGIIQREHKRGDVQVEVPFSVLLGSRQARHGVAYALHATTGRPMVRWEDGSREQYEGYNAYRPLGDADVAEGLRLQAALDAASKALRQFTDSHRLYLHNAVQEAIEKALSERGES